VTAITTARRRVIGVIAAKLAPSATWSWGDMPRAAAWMAIGIAALAPLVARIEGALDHDQSVVGLMALDIAAGRRWPVFFDGQRYMGAVEAYTAAGFVALFGPSPTVVALAPLLFFGFFAAGQYALWRCGSGRATGHLAALVAVLGSPMLALWSIVPRGGLLDSARVCRRGLIPENRGSRSRTLLALANRDRATARFWASEPGDVRRPRGGRRLHPPTQRIAPALGRRRGCGRSPQCWRPRAGPEPALGEGSGR
jgi:hypothetical protein